MIMYVIIHIRYGKTPAAVLFKLTRSCGHLRYSKKSAKNTIPLLILVPELS